MFVADRHHRYGSVVGNGHCVAFVREAAGAPHTALWRQGERVRGGDVPSGTVIATFDDTGRYRNATDGSSHAAVLLAETAAGLVVADQWIGQPLHERTIRFKGGNGMPCDDGDQYHVVITDAPDAAAA
jgi:hypothetical protein